MASQLLTYSQTTNPLPLQASLVAAAGVTPVPAVLTVLASNATGQAVPLTYLQFQLAVGATATDLVATNDAGNVKVVVSDGAGNPVPFTLTNIPGTTGTYVFKPSSPPYSLAAGAGLTFVFTDLLPNTTAGATSLNITQGGSGGVLPAALPLVKFPADWGPLVFTASPTNIQAGSSTNGTTTLSWDGPAGPVYQVAYYDFAAQQQVLLPATNQALYDNQGALPGLAPIATTTYTLLVTESITGELYDVQAQQTVTVQPLAPLITQLAFTPTIVEMGAAATLAWTAQNVSELVVDGVGTYSGATAQKGQATVIPAASTLYQATAYGLAGASSGVPAVAQASVYVIELIQVEVVAQQNLNVISEANGLLGSFAWSQATTLDFPNSSPAYTQYSFVFSVEPGNNVAIVGTQQAATPYKQLTAIVQGVDTVQGIVLLDLLNDGSGQLNVDATTNYSTVGLQLRDGTYGLLWLAAPTSPNANYEGSLALTFNWLHFPTPPTT